MKHIRPRALTFDDVALVPQYSEIPTRHSVDTSIGFGGLTLKTPILSANMETVTGNEMCRAMYAAGGLGVLHRFQNLEDFEHPDAPFVASVGVNKYIDRLKAYHLEGVKMLCIDVAHGDHIKVKELLRYIKAQYRDDFFVIAGNVCTHDAALRLIHWGADAIKCGVGPGSHCTTRVVTGHGTPQLQAVLECAEAIANVKPSVKLIADGGIRNSGDIGKAIAAGADAVMIGKLLAGADEAPSIKNTHFGTAIYRGSASFESQSARKQDKSKIIAEGVASTVPMSGPVKNTIDKLTLGLKSCLSYTGASNIETFKTRSQLIEVSPSSYLEGTPHGKEK